MQNSLIHIIALEWIQAYKLRGLSIALPGNECSLPETALWETLDIEVPAKLETQSETNDKDQSVASTLTFRSCELIPANTPLCYLATLRNGSKVVIGGGQRPFCTTHYRKVHPDNVAESTLYEYTIKWTARTGPLTLRLMYP